MTYRIDLSSVAKAEADAAFLSFAQYTTPERAQEWYQGTDKSNRQPQNHASSLPRCPRKRLF
jgi:hypothetical protein